MKKAGTRNRLSSTTSEMELPHQTGIMCTKLFFYHYLAKQK